MMRQRLVYKEPAVQPMCGICSMFRAETGYRGRGVIGNALTPEDTRVAATVAGLGTLLAHEAHADCRLVCVIVNQ